ncbi:uncharacterized protein Dwil_GK14837 [Drosophila willistoni]|uniref:Peptidase S1 domain-containing protein n=1 Tax=Drosophila willistoni TaxID=7260 RepID=A0A0Q9WS05_DROWI|nr:uncharacterized protein Dwil_GK14837 [Drosophila willistoni]
MFTLITKGILVSLIIYLADYNKRQSELEPDDQYTTTTEAYKGLPLYPTRAVWKSSYQTCGTNKTCVPYQRCPNRQWLDELVDYNDTDRRCKYMEVCCPDNWTLLQDTDLEQPPLVYDPRNCKFTLPSMTQNLTYVQQLTLPWTVSLIYNSNDKWKYFCSGALVTYRMVITDSSCFARSIYGPMEMYVVAGEFGTNLLYPKTQERRVLNRFNSFGGEHSFPFLSSDIALLVVEEFSLNEDIQPICLPPPQEEVQQRKFLYRNCLSTAFPAVRNAKLLESPNNRHYDLQLRRRFRVDPLNETDCNAFGMTKYTHGQDNRLLPSLLCMGRDEGRDHSVCFAEMGAPIVCEVVNQEEEENTMTYRLGQPYTWDEAYQDDYVNVEGCAQCETNYRNFVFVLEHKELPDEAATSNYTYVAFFMWLCLGSLIAVQRYRQIKYKL